MIESKANTIVLYDNSGKEVDKFPMHCLYEISPIEGNLQEPGICVVYFDEEKLKKLPDNAQPEDIVDCLVKRILYGHYPLIKARQ